jgi:hypothetical protein
MKLKSTSYTELAEVVGKSTTLEFEGGFSVVRTTTDSFIVEKDGKSVLGVAPDDSLVLFPEENTPSVRHKINQFLPEGVKLSSKKNVLYLNDSPLKKYNLVSSDGSVQMEDN